MIYNIFHGYDYGIINYVCNFFKKIYLIIFKFQKHNLNVSKCHKIGYFNIFLPTKKEVDCLPEYPTRKCLGWVGSGWG